MWAVPAIVILDLSDSAYFHLIQKWVKHGWSEGELVIETHHLSQSYQSKLLVVFTHTIDCIM